MTGPRYNPNDPGSVLQGLAGLIQGLGNLRDPNKDKRDRLQALLQQNPQLREQYQQQYSGNPDALNALLGRKPLFGKSNRDDLSSLITGGQVSPEGVRNSQISQLQAKSAINDNSSSIADATKRVPQLADFSKSTIQGAANSGIGMNPDEKTSLTEYTALGRFLTPQERILNETRQKGAEAETRRAIAEAGVSEQTAGTRVEGSKLDLDTAKKNLEIASDKKKLEDTYRKTANQVQARLGKGQNLYTAYKAGKVSADEFSAIQATPESRNAFNDSMTDYYRQLTDSRERELHGANMKSIREQRVGTFAQHLMEKLDFMGTPISYNQALQMAEDPSKADDKTKAAMLDINKKDREATMFKFKGDFLRQASPILQQLAKPGANADPNLIQQLNNASVDNTPPGYEPVIYGIQEVKTPGKIFGMAWPNKQNVPVILSGDKELAKASGGPLGKPIPPGATPTGSAPKAGTPGKTQAIPNNSKPQLNIDAFAQDAVDNNWDDAQIQATLKAAGYDVSLLNQIRQAKLTKKKKKGGNSVTTPTKATSDTTDEQHLWDMAVAKHGKDKVIAEIGPRP